MAVTQALQQIASLFDPHVGAEGSDRVRPCRCHTVLASQLHLAGDRSHGWFEFPLIRHEKPRAPGCPREPELEEQNAELAASPKAFREFVGGLRSDRRGPRKLLRRSFGAADIDTLDIEFGEYRLDGD